MATETTITRPAPFIEELGTELGRQITAQQGIPLVAQTVAGLGTGPTQRTGETDEQFKLRQDLFTKRQDAAQMFEDRQTSIGALAPQVAGQDALQQRAQSIAEAQAGQTGLAGFQPFLNQAQVIDATLTEFDRNKAIQEQQIKDQQTALGALGSGRAGVQLAEFGTGAARERALLQAGLLQQGFGQAQAARQQDIANQFGIGQAQLGLGQAQAGIGGQQAGIAGGIQNLGQFRSGLAGQQAALGQAQEGVLGTNISRLGSLGALNQAQAQAQADAQREATRQAAFLPQEQLDRYAAQGTGIMGGYPGQTQTTNIPNPTPLQSALGVGTTLAGLYGMTNPTRNLFGPKN